MKIGEKLKTTRQQKGYSQSELSKIVNIPQTTISDFENDKYLPDLKQANDLAKALNITLEKLQD